MKKGLLLFCLMVPLVHAEMVDTFEFSSPAERTRAVTLAKSLRCPQCQNQNLVESNSLVAYDLRIEVYKMVEEGKTNEQIIEVMTNRFGDFVRYNPPVKSTTILLWGLPFVLLIVGGLAMWQMFRIRRKQEKKSLGLTVEQQQALNALLEKSDKTE